MVHRAQATVNRAALAHNLAVAKRHAPHAKVVAVIKANAYGHGLLPVAEALHGADMFGVTDVEEAELLRRGGCDKDILILQGLIEAGDIDLIGEHGYQLVIHDHEHLQWLEAAFDRKPPRAPLRFWLKLDSGMGRLGLRNQDYLAVCRALLTKPWTAGVVTMTHFASASDPEAPLNIDQLTRYRQSQLELAELPRQASIASSAVVLGMDEQADWIRPGIMLYGSSPFAWQDSTRRREALSLRAVMTLQGRLISVKQHQGGDSIGYNSQFICPEPMRVGTVSVGYADGYPSCAPNHTPVLVHGIRSGTLGRVSMDMLAVDLSHVPQARSGDLVTLWGEDLSLDEIAAHTGILSYNLTCSITARVPRVYV